MLVEVCDCADCGVFRKIPTSLPSFCVRRGRFLGKEDDDDDEAILLAIMNWVMATINAAIAVAMLRGFREAFKLQV